MREKHSSNPKKKKFAEVLLFTPTGIRQSTQRAAQEGSKQEVEQYEPPAFVARALLYVLVALVVIGFAWAALSKVDVVVEAPGQLVPKGKVKIIQPIAAGVVEALLVREGQQVKPGDSLVLLERTPYAAELNKQERALEIAKSDLEQTQQAKQALEEIIANPGVVPTVKADVGDIGQVVGNVYSAYIARREAAADYSQGQPVPGGASPELAALQVKLGQLQAQKAVQERTLASRRLEYRDRQAAKVLEVAAQKRALEGAMAEREEVEAVLSKTQLQEAAYKKVFDQGAVSLVDYLNISKEVERAKRELVRHDSTIADLAKRLEIAVSEERQLRAQSRADLAQQEAELKRLSSEIASVQIQIRDNERRYRLSSADFDAALAKAKAALEKVRADVAQSERRVSQVESELRVAQRSFNEAEVKSPIAGTVTGIEIRGKGHVVKEGEPLMTVVPADTELVVEARVSNKDIGFVEKGQAAKLKFAAFPFQDYGVVRGKVSDIEAHAEEDPDLGSIYKVTITPERSWIQAKGRKVQFVSGLAVTSEVVVRQRSILDIFLEPVKKLKEVPWL